MQPDIAEIARGLTPGQLRRVIQAEVIVLHSRHDTRCALNLQRKGVSERGRHLNQFVLTPLGLQVREYLLSKDKTDGDR